MNAQTLVAAIIQKDAAGIDESFDAIMRDMIEESIDEFRVEIAQDILSERNKENAIMRKVMDASRGAKYKANGNATPERDDSVHPTAQAQNKAIGRALRKEETGRHWHVKRVGDDVKFQGANGSNTATVKHSAMMGE